jgi:5'-nucleotidase
MEAALQGLRAVALSQFMGPKLADLETPFEAARDYGVAVIRKLLDHGVWSSDGAYKIFYNVNFPPVPSADVRGMRICTQGRREDCTFTTVPHDSPAGRRFLWIKSGYQHNPSDPSTDAGACVDGYIAITPMRADLTAHDTMDALRAVFE